jgi:hypothetical protein
METGVPEQVALEPWLEDFIHARGDVDGIDGGCVSSALRKGAAPHAI